MSAWTLNDSTLASLGLALSRISFRAQGASECTLSRACDFDAPPLLSYGQAAALKLNGNLVFQGKVASAPVEASGPREGQSILLRDAWEELEQTIYQEEWFTGGTPPVVMLPRTILGLVPGMGGWRRAKVGEMVRRVLEYAVAQGVSIAIGTIPDGEEMLPSELENSSCAEVIRECLRLHPDWIPHLVHTTSPPTFHIVSAGDSAVDATVDLTGGRVADFAMRPRTDMRPAAVRIVYEMAEEIDGEVYRKVYVDKFPGGGPDGGPRVLQAVIPLAGMQMQIQKSRVQTRALPPTGASQLAAKKYLRAKFPRLKSISLDDMHVSEWSVELAGEDPDEFPDPISPRAPRLALDSVDDAPRELVRGSLEDWMRRKAGRVQVHCRLAARPTLSRADREAIEAIPEDFYVTGTNAQTKIYKSISQWTAPEDVPVGVAAATYRAILAAMSWEGHVSLEDEECGGFSWHGKTISLLAGGGADAPLKAPVHSVELDIARGVTRIEFGPHPYLAPADFLELQRILRHRPTRWWSFAERGSDRHGAEAEPSAAGDSVGPFELPENSGGGTAPRDAQFQVSAPFFDEDSSAWKVRVSGGDVLTLNPYPGAPKMIYTPVADATLDVAAGMTVYCHLATSKWDVPTGVNLLAQAAAPNVQHARTEPGGLPGSYFYKIATISAGENGELKVEKRWHENGPILHRPIHGNEDWVNVTFKLCDEENERFVLAIRGGLASIHSSVYDTPAPPAGIIPKQRIFEVASCHCCGELEE